MRILLFLFFVLALAGCSTVETKHSELTQQKKSGAAAAGLAKTNTAGNKNNKKQVKQTLASNNKTDVVAAAATSEPIQLGLLDKADQLGKENKWVEAVRVYAQCTTSCFSEKEKSAAKMRAIEIINNKFTTDQLKQSTSESGLGELRGYAAFHLAQEYFSERDRSSAKTYYSLAASLCPNTDIGSISSNQVRLLDSSSSAEQANIGAILPLTGKNALIGQRALRGLQMGLGLHQPGAKFTLFVIDSEGNPDVARRAVERLVIEDKVIAIIGGLLSKTASAEAAKADELGVPILALSQKSGLTDAGPNVFRSAITAQMQVRTLVRTAMAKGMKRFAIMYPNDAYGVEYSNLFWDEVLARGGEITAAQTYNPRDNDFRYVTQRLAGTFYIESRADEYRARVNEIKASDKKKSARENTEEDILPAIVDFDGIFIPDSAKNMGQVAAFLSLAGIRQVTLLGTNLWNVDGLGRRAGNFSKELLFVDNIAPQSLAQSSLTAEYKNMFNEDPGGIEIQSYDSGLILRQLISNGASSRQKLQQQLAGLNKFPGITGPLSTNSDREIVRPLVSLTLENGEITAAKIR